MSDSLCARCARQGKTCCQQREIYVTPGDADRIRKVIGNNDFCHFRVPEDPAYLEQDHDPEWLEHVFRPDGSRRILRRLPNGDCPFLGQAGCRLNLETRPLVCRLYPFLYSARGFEPRLEEGCPGQLIPQGQDLLQVLGMNRAQAEVWHRQLYAEIRTEGAVCASV